MGLTLAQQSIWQKARSLGAGGQGIALSDAACAYLIGTIAGDLGLSDSFPELPRSLPGFFSPIAPDDLVVRNVNALALFERLVGLVADVDTYFSCLAWLHKARVKYDLIMRTQPVPTLEQVGPRGLVAELPRRHRTIT